MGVYEIDYLDIICLSSYLSPFGIDIYEQFVCDLGFIQHMYVIGSIGKILFSADVSTLRF